MRKFNNKKGFTLIELLAVIVILGIIMAIAIPSMTGYINNSRKDTMLSTAQQYIAGARTLLITENSLPGFGEAVVVPVDLIGVDQGGTSPYTNKTFSNNYGAAATTDAADGKSYVIVMNDVATGNINTEASYTYVVTLFDEKNTCLIPVSETFIATAPTRLKRTKIATATTGNTNPCINQVKVSATPAANANVAIKYYDGENGTLVTKTFKNTTALPKAITLYN